MPRGDRSRPGGERTAADRERDRLERARRRAAEPLAEQPVEPAPSKPASPEPVLSDPPLSDPPLSEPAPLEPSVSEPQPVDQPTVESALPELPPLPAPVSALAAPPPAGQSTGAQRPTRGRSLIPRLAALLALAAVVVAVVALLHAHDSKSVAPPPPREVKVLIPEGKTRIQIAQIATADGLKGSYRAASRHSSLIDLLDYGAPTSTPDLEGFLFPATYDVDAGAPVAQLVQKQLAAFHEHFGASQIARARALHVTPYQLLTVASMVEREAQIPGDRPKIAAVIYNRLAAGMPLGIDASIYYAVELATGIPTYTHELSESQLHIDSPYNTRTHVGLPPTPISNPGAASIEAAAHPAHVSYLYYVAGADGCGEQVFSDTLAQFEVNAAAYKAAVARGGGHPPTCKHTLTGAGK